MTNYFAPSTATAQCLKPVSLNVTL